MNVREFERRAKTNGGYDRAFGSWKIIDVHQIELPMSEQNECDFYCCDGKNVYLLRLRNRQNERLVKIVSGSLPTYLIAELPVERIDDQFIGDVLAKFNDETQVEVEVHDMRYRQCGVLNIISAIMLVLLFGLTISGAMYYMLFPLVILGIGLTPVLVLFGVVPMVLSGASIYIKKNTWGIILLIISILMGIFLSL